MRWLSFVRDGQTTFGYVTSDGAGVVDAGAHSQYGSLREAIAAGALSELPQTCGDQADLPLADITYAPTITDPKKILCVGLNYKAHQEETGRGGEGVPTIFVRFAAAQVAHNQPMIRPRESNTLDYEGEIALIIGKPGRRIPRVEALQHVAGFGIYNDGSVREYQRQTSQFTPGKNFTATGGFGPWMMTLHEIGDLSDDVLTFLLPSRYCDSDALVDVAWAQFGNGPTGRPRTSTSLKRLPAIPCSFDSWTRSKPIRPTKSPGFRRLSLDSSVSADRFTSASETSPTWPRTCAASEPRG